MSTWSEEDINTAYDMKLEGVSVPDILNHFNGKYTKSQYKYMLKKNRDKFSVLSSDAVWNEKTFKKISESWIKGDEIKDILKEHNISRNQLASMSSKNREFFPKRGNSNTRINQDKVVSLVNIGMTSREIADEMGFHEKSICRVISNIKKNPKGRLINITVSKPKSKTMYIGGKRHGVARKGEGFNLKQGNMYLHMSGESLTRYPFYAYRGTYTQSKNMIKVAKSEYGILGLQREKEFG